MDSNKATLEPVLLNGGDIIGMGYLVTNYSGDVEVEGRVAGVKEIERKKEPPDRLALARRLALVTSVTAFAFGIVAITSPLAVESASPSLSAVASAAIGVAGATSIVASYQLVRIFRRIQDR